MVWRQSTQRRGRFTVPTADLSAPCAPSNTQVKNLQSIIGPYTPLAYARLPTTFSIHPPQLLVPTWTATLEAPILGTTARKHAARNDMRGLGYSHQAV